MILQRVVLLLQRLLLRISSKEKKMYYVDCDCSDHDEFRKFKVRDEAENHFNGRKCKNKILYGERENGDLYTIKEVSE